MINKENRKIFTDPLLSKNPITFLVLGFCSALAVTVKMETAIVMSLAFMFVLSISNTIISMLRTFIPSRVRIIVQLTIVASLVIITDLVLKAYVYNVSKQLSVFVALIITNCIVMGRAEGFAMQNSPGKSFLDGLGNALGYGFALVTIAFFREFFGSGTVSNFQLIPSWFYEAGYKNAGFWVLSPGAFIIIGLLVWLQRTFFPQPEHSSHAGTHGQNG